MNSSNLKIKEEYEKLKHEYIVLENKYNRLNSRLDSIIKILQNVNIGIETYQMKVLTNYIED